METTKQRKYSNEPVINNEDMDRDTFVYSDSIYDYCIVNGESLTKYYEKEGGAYESLSIHKISDPMELLDDSRMHWMRTLLKYDALSGKPKYKKKKELLDRISKRAEEDLF